jgi:cardiolipin synthase
VAGLSDGIDGYLARRFNWTSEFGQFADPLADKCLILATLLALAFSERLPLWFVYTMLTRDGLILIGSMLYLLLFDSNQASPNRWGKHYTGWTIALFIIVLVGSSFDIVPPFIEWIAMSGVLVFIVMSLGSYFNKEGRAIFKQII